VITRDYCCSFESNEILACGSRNRFEAKGTARLAKPSRVIVATSRSFSSQDVTSLRLVAGCSRASSVSLIQLVFQAFRLHISCLACLDDLG